MDYIIRPEDPPPGTKKELTHIEQVAFQMFIAGFDPIQITFYAALFFLLKHPQILARLTKEIRNSFNNYDEITPDALSNLKYLHAVISESLRAHLTIATGLPRISSGAIVDGVVCHLSSFKAMRGERYLRDPLGFHPERWLSSEHPLYDTRYADDNLKSFFPFGLGPRKCTGREIAWSQTRLFLGKVLWSFDLEGVRGHEKSFDEFKVYVMWNRPELWVRYSPVDR
ncbi:hypothetical protein HYALB_00007275 [Hymenoscyphus albidus]|uniref:Cytochrome P450 n=1 Tax=Hymenoscyphus albidus TaxID=595503 RepID=A0A9N9QBX9_9HELO|nr:hypothetical protein HYALB_00007275 [Hymenoscyphus albidus]